MWRIEDNYLKKTGILGQYEFNFVMSKLRKEWIKDEISLDEYEKSKYVIENLSINKDTDGCLQDIHWFAGLFGYFPTYSLGALTAAQFASQLRIEQKELDKEIENGEFSNLVNWLKKNIHEKASFFSTNEVLEQVTKSPLNAKYFKEYITNRYL